MNQQIKELATSARLSYVMTPDRPYIEDDLQKFAELIMDECAKACCDPDCNTLMSPLDLIKQHFGMQ